MTDAAITIFTVLVFLATFIGLAILISKAVSFLVGDTDNKE